MDTLTLADLHAVELAPRRLMSTNVSLVAIFSSVHQKAVAISGNTGGGGADASNFNASGNVVVLNF